MIVGMETLSGGGGSGAPELVWVNPNVSNMEGVSFASQTLNESSSGWVSGKSIADYDAFIIATVYNTSSYTGRGACLSYVANDVSALAAPFTTNYVPIATARNTSSGNTVYARNVTLSSSGITFDSSGGDSVNVPMYIWGVKGALTTS